MFYVCVVVLMNCMYDFVIILLLKFITAYRLYAGVSLITVITVFANRLECTRRVLRIGGLIIHHVTSCLSKRNYEHQSTP
jgi:hypothetical protein